MAVGYLAFTGLMYNLFFEFARFFNLLPVKKEKAL
jgi:hypothetical protein